VNGRGLILFDGNTGSGGFDFEDTTHAVHPGIFVANDNSINLQAIKSIGLNLADSGGRTRANITSGGLKISSGILPLDGPGAMPVGSSALPFSGVFIGGAAANNALLTGTFAQPINIILPDPNQAAATLAYRDIAQIWTGNQTNMTLRAPTLSDATINGRISGTGIQGTDLKLLTSGPLSGVGNILCVDANGGATTSGCGAATVKSIRSGVSCRTARHSYSSCTTALTWPTAFPDVNYSVTCTGIGPSDPRAGLSIANRSAASVTVNIVTYGSVAVSFSEIDCMAVTTTDTPSTQAGSALDPPSRTPIHGGPISIRTVERVDEKREPK
jgi:hypothetical protein